MPPARALDVERGGHAGVVVGWCRRVNDGGHDGSGERIARCGWVEVQDGRFAFCVWVYWWWWGDVMAGDHWSVRTRCVIF